MHCSVKPNVWFIILPILLVVVSCQTVNFKKRFNYLNKVAVGMQHDFDSVAHKIHLEKEMTVSDDSVLHGNYKYDSGIEGPVPVANDMSAWDAVNQIFYKHSGFSLKRLTPMQNPSLASAGEETEIIFLFLFILSVALMIAFIWLILSGEYFEGLGCAGCVLFFFIFAILATLIGYSLERI